MSRLPTFEEKYPKLSTAWFIIREVLAWILFFVIVYSMLAIQGCNSISLPHRYTPLTEILEFDIPIIPDSCLTTVGTSVCVADISSFDITTQNSVAELLHEQAHSRRQENYPYLGTLGWIVNYLFDRDFARNEEEIGWRMELEYKKAHRISVDIPATVAALRTYRVITGYLWDTVEAQKWVESVVKH